MLLGCEKGFDAMVLLDGILEVNIVCIGGLPLFTRRCWSTIGLGEEGSQRGVIHGKWSLTVMHTIVMRLMRRLQAFRSLLWLVPALLWLPTGIVALTLIRGITWPTDLATWLQLLPGAPCGLPLAFAWRRFRHWPLTVAVSAAKLAVICLAMLTVVAVLVAGLLGPMAMAVVAVVISLPAWLITLLLSRRCDRCTAPH